MIQIEGIVNRIRYYQGKREYTLTDGIMEHGFYCEETIPHGSCVSIEGDMGVEKIAVKKVVILSGEKAQKLYEKVKMNIAANITAAVNTDGTNNLALDAPSLLKDEVTEKIWPHLKEAVIELVCAKKLNRSVLLRFHGDADGICGAFALTNVIQCKAFQQNSAIYSVKDALRDMATVGQESRPLFILLDFGSGEGSTEGLGLLAAAGIDYLIIDHHPYEAKENEWIINPFAISDSASKYTAGYLACEVAVACGFDREKALELAKVACCGDKSEIFGTSTTVDLKAKEVKKAMVLDFLASHVSFGNNLDFYKKVMEKDELFESIVQQADESIEEAAQKAMAKMKRTATSTSSGDRKRGPEDLDLEVVTFQLEGIVKKGEWPPSSKITTRVFDKLKAEHGSSPGALICIGYTERSIIMRLNDKAVEAGLSANALAAKLKTTMADFVEGGGGHVKAGAIRVKIGFAKDVLNELIREIER